MENFVVFISTLQMPQTTFYVAPQQFVYIFLLLDVFVAYLRNRSYLPVRPSVRLYICCSIHSHSCTFVCLFECILYVLCVMFSSHKYNSLCCFHCKVIVVSILLVVIFVLEKKKNKTIYGGLFGDFWYLDSLYKGPKHRHHQHFFSSTVEKKND